MQQWCTSIVFTIPKKNVYVHQQPWCSHVDVSFFFFFLSNRSWFYTIYLYVNMLWLWLSILLQLTPSMVIYDTMQSLQSPIGRYCVRYAYNLAGFLLSTGEKVIYLFFKGIHISNEVLLYLCFSLLWNGKGSTLCNLTIFFILILIAILHLLYG